MQRTLARISPTHPFAWSGALLISFALLACDDGNSDDDDDDDAADSTTTNTVCVEGNEGCACYPNNTCNGGLTCLSTICVNASPTSTSTTSAADTTDDGGTSTGTESGNAEATTLTTLGDDTTSNTASTSASTSTSEGEEAATSEEGELEGTDDGPNACTPAGTCAAGNGQDCEDDVLVPRDCSGCGLLSCGVACCASIGYFGAVTYPDFYLLPELVASFTQSDTEVGLRMDFTGSNETGAISFALSDTHEIDPIDLSIELSATGSISGAVTVTLEDGEDGCLYEAIGVEETANGVLVALPSIAEYCWGTFAEGSSVRQINVRIDSESSGSAFLSVFSVAW